MFSLLVTETAPFFMGKIWEVTPAIGPLGDWAIGCQASVPQKAKPAKAFPGQPAQPWRLPQEKLDHG